MGQPLSSASEPLLLTMKLPLVAPQTEEAIMRLLVDGSNLSLRFAAGPNPTLYSPDGAPRTPAS